MKKFFIKILLAFVTASGLNINIAYAAFSDLFLAHPNYKAIVYLEENGVINGYPDGTFKPNSEVNRAEFLKIIIEGSKIPINVFYPTPFPDVNHTLWYAPYIKKAYKEGWINGYPDGTFRPDQTINKAEALKILAKVQNWDLQQNFEQPFSDTPSSEWFTPYISYAKNHNFLEENGWTFAPENNMTRAKISEIIYRTLTIETQEKPEEPAKPEEKTTTPKKPEPEPEPAQTPKPQPEPAPAPTPEPVEDFTSVSFKTIGKNFYDKITLDEELPNIFYQNEVYFIEGNISTAGYNSASVILEGESNDSKSTFKAELNNNRFSIPVYFSRPGNYILGLLPGESGSSKAAAISVLQELPATSSNTPSTKTINNQNIYFSNDKTFVEFTTGANTLKKVSFTQNNQAKTYLLRQNESQFPINYADFRYFQEDTVTYSVSVADISTTKPLVISSGFNNGITGNFSAIGHQFSEKVEDQISANPPEKLTAPQAITFNGTAKTDLKQDAYVIKPDGFVEDVVLSTNSATYSYLDNNIIKSGGNFTYSYTPSSTGTYIVEINNKNGEPSLNHAVYIGNGMPLLPDFFDTHQRTTFEGAMSLSAARTELLNLINAGRAEHGLNEIELSNELNDIAQAHSKDMAENNFFGHVNPKGQTPEDRRLAAGIKTSIGENLALDTSIEAAHYGLMRSASHRSNILTEDWERVGIGVELKDGQLHITEEFSILELSASDIVQFENELLTSINNKRADMGIGALSQPENVKAASTYINNKIINEDADLNNSLFSEALDANNVSGSSELIGRISGSGNWTSTLESIIDQESPIIQATWQLIGIDIQVDSIGDLHTILILNKP